MHFKIEHYKELASTNQTAKEAAEKGAPEGLVVRADHQSAGRGKPGRKWLSPRGKNLLFSLLIRPSIKAHQAPLLTQVSCRSVAQVLKEEYGISSVFKRPNDILVQGKKICGILVETVTGRQNKVEAAVIGIGLNVNAAPSPRLLPDAICIKDLTGKALDLEKILHQILTQLAKDLECLYVPSA